MVFLGVLELCLPFSSRSDQWLVFPNGPKVGDHAPPLHLAKLLNAPTNAEASWPALKGKVVVLDFWATWCGPCVASIPHMNDLVTELKGEPVQFIAITAEPENLVTEFFKKSPLSKKEIDEAPPEFKPEADRIVKAFQQPNPIKAWVGLDDLAGRDADNYYGGSTVSGYFFQGVPHCVVVDKDGVIAAYAHPMQLTAKFLRAVAAGEHPTLKPVEEGKLENEIRLHAEQSPDSPGSASFEAIIRRTREWLPHERRNVAFAWDGSTRFLQFDVSLTDALKAAGALVRLDVQTPLPGAHHDFIFRVPADNFPAIFAAALRSSFGLAVEQGVEEEDVFFLRLAENAKIRNMLAREGEKEEVSQGGVYQNGRHIEDNITVHNEPMSYFIGMALGNRAGKTVIDQTGLKDKYSFVIKWPDGAAPEAWKQALEKETGLILVPGKLPHPVLHIRAK